MAIAIPKKTKIFIEQTVRERENSSAIHNIFQSELWRMRLEAAKVTVEILRTGDSTFSGDYQTPLKLLAQVDGLGPDFLLTVTLENISATRVVTNLSILLHADPRHYGIARRYAEITPLLPGKPLTQMLAVSFAVIRFSRNSAGYGFQHCGPDDLRKPAARRHDARELDNPRADHEGGAGEAADSVDGGDAAARNANAVVENFRRNKKQRNC